MTKDNPLVDADLMTDLDFCLLRGELPKDSKESVLELCLSSAASLLAAARSSL